MGNSWVRLWLDMPTDPKFRTVSKLSKQPLSAVIAVFVCMMTDAANATERGRTSINDEDLASTLDLEIEQVSAIREAMQGRLLDGDLLTGWARRQPIREDGSAARSKAWRDRQKAEQQQERNRTQPNAKKRPDTDTDTDSKYPPTPHAGGVGDAPLNGKPKPDPAVSAATDPLTLPLPDCVPLAAWVDWISYRRSRRLTCREETLTRQLAFLCDANNRGTPPEQIIELAIRNGWQGLFEPKGSKSANRHDDTAPRMATRREFH